MYPSSSLALFLPLVAPLSLNLFHIHTAAILSASISNFEYINGFQTFSYTGLPAILVIHSPAVIFSKASKFFTYLDFKTNNPIETLCQKDNGENLSKSKGEVNGYSVPPV
jgi:hypothetical protein